MNIYSQNISNKGTLLFLLLIASPFISVGLFADEDFLIRFFPDDAFYYIQTAWNFSQAGKISFDGVNWTNGFHPLFFVISAFFTLLFPKHIFLNVFFLLNLFFIFSSVLLCINQLNNNISSPLKYLFLLFFTLPAFLFYAWISCGMEAGLVILTTVLFFWAWVQAIRKNFKDKVQNLLLGAAITLLILSRLDLILILPPFVFYICSKLLQRGNGLTIKNSLWIFILPLIFGGLYLTLNVIFTEHIIPISGVAKRLLSEEPSRISWESITSINITGLILTFTPIMGSLAFFMFASIPRLRKKFSPAHLNAILLLNIGLILFYLYLLFFAFFAWNLFFWYFAFPEAVLLITGVLLIGSIFSEMPFQNSIWNYRISVIGLGLFINILVNSYFLIRWVPWEQNTSYQLIKVSRKIDRLCGPNAVIGAFDAGIIGYYTAGRVINLDGLANNFDYFENYLVPKRLKEYLIEQGATHLFVAEEHLINRKEIKKGDYTSAILKNDPRIGLARNDEQFRNFIPNWGNIYLFKLNL